jgi:hypothetical protein
MRARTAEAPTPELTGIGTINPGTRKAGTVGLRIGAVLSAVALTAAVRPVNANVQRMWAALHNWAGPKADQLGHFRHAGLAIHVKAGHGLLATGDRWPWTAGIAGALLLIWLVLAANKLRRPTPGTLAARGVATLAGILVAVLVAVVAVVWGLAQFKQGQLADAQMLRFVAWGAGLAQQGAAGLIGTEPTPLTHVTGG